MARLPRKVREINDFNATDWFEKLLQRTTNTTPSKAAWVAFFVVITTWLSGL
jgi:LPS sulfotransferase NodH